MRLTWDRNNFASDTYDVTLIPKRVTDPDAYLFTDDKKWILVKDGNDLKDLGKDDDSVIAVICDEALSERPDIYGWERRVRRIFYVTQEVTADIEAGVITGTQRYRLRDLAAEHEQSWQ